MRTLKFIVDDQIIKKDPDCDFSNIVPGSEGYLKAEFSFSSEWNGFAKIASFYSTMGTEFKPQILKDGTTCIIPAEALKRIKFEVGVVGKNNLGMKLTTNKIEVKQDGGII